MNTPFYLNLYTNKRVLSNVFQKLIYFIDYNNLRVQTFH